MTKFSCGLILTLFALIILCEFKHISTHLLTDSCNKTCADLTRAKSVHESKSTKSGPGKVT